MDRWTRKAREGNPQLDDGQAAALAEQLRADFYRQIGAARGASRRGRPRTPGPEPEAGRPKVPTAGSPRHLRWPLLARQRHPGASDDDIERIAAELRAGHSRRIWETRRASSAAST